MVTFGLITEGKTDQIVIENVLSGYFNSVDMIINWLLPLRDESDKYLVENYSNWLKVFEYSQSSKFKEALQFNDYIIIQVDTDVSEEKHYDIPKYEAGRELTPDELVQKVVEKFKGLIGEEFYLQHKERIIFAISVHSIECWLLPLYYTNKQKQKTKNCLDTLNRAVRKNEGFTISNKNVRKYEDISWQYCKHKRFMKLYKANPSLRIFIEEIQKRKIVLDEET
jgi:hypothetical protein